MSQKSKPSALIVDDEPDIRELLDITLTGMNINTHLAATLGEAKHLLATKRPDFCLTDMRLPEVNSSSSSAPAHSQKTAPTVAQPAEQKEARAASGAQDLNAALEAQQREIITRALEETRWNRTAAAKKLGITFRALRYRLKKLGLE